jgi:hypothetical protein
VESVSILRALTRRPLLLALGALLALAVGLLGAYRVSSAPPFLESKMTSVGYASQRVLVDTPESLIADARAKGATSIVIRATVLADQLSSDDVHAAIARRLRVKPDEIGSISSTTAIPETESPLAKQVLEVTKPTQPYVVSVGLEGGQPILAIQAAAPDPRRAAQLMSATTTALAAAGRDAVPARGPVRVVRLGGADVGVKQAGGGKKKAAIGAAAVFVLWCVALVAADGVARRRRMSSWDGEPVDASFSGGASFPR